MKKKIESYQGAAGGWGAVKSVANAVRKQMDIRQDVIAMFDMNKPEGFDCPGCAWPDPKHSASFDICENGAKAIAWEVTDKQVNASFFAENTVQSLLTWGDHELEAAGRLTQPLKYDDVSDCYKPLSWQQAFDEIREVVDTYKIGIDKAIEAAQKSTPTLLSLMDEGVRFTNGYVAHGVSGPSRAAIMTGRAPARFGVYSNTDAQDGIPLTETFLPELFQNHGYYTAAVGKWHLSKISNVPVPEDKQTRDYHDNFTTYSAEEWQPQNRGFDYFMGFHAAGTAYYNSPSLFKNRERVPAKGYISDQLTDEAIGVVDRAKTLDQPFMLYLAYNAPHLPNDNPAPEQYQKQFNTGSQTADNYYASVYSVDQGVKRILEQLKKNGQYDNTIILFTSDNGAVIDGPLPLNGAQKGYKSQTYPGGTHTPMFMWWKGKLQPGNYDKLISAMDFYPTALDAADISIPKDLKLDGVSLLPWLQNKKQGEPHKNLTWITSYSHWFDEENIPFWDNYHKFVRHQSDDYPHNPNTEDLSQFSYTVRNNDYSLVYTVENNQLGLYKLTDLQQKDNLAAANPQVVKEMQGVVREFIDNSQPPLSEVNQEKFNNIKKALSEAK